MRRAVADIFFGSLFGAIAIASVLGVLALSGCRHANMAPNASHTCRYKPVDGGFLVDCNDF